MWKTDDLMNVSCEKIENLTNNGDMTNLNHDKVRKAFVWLVEEVKKSIRNCK